MRNEASTWLFVAKLFVWFEGSRHSAVPCASVRPERPQPVRRVGQFAGKLPCIPGELTPAGDRREKAAGLSLSLATNCARNMEESE